MTMRLTLLAHAETAATRHAAFARPHEPIVPHARAVLSRWATPRCDRVLTSPAAAARETAAALGLAAEVNEGLADLAVGAWIGRGLAEIAAADPAGAAAFVADPAFAGHGGEPIAGLIARVGAWLQSHGGDRGRLLAVTHPAVVRAAVVAALGAPHQAFWRIDVPPLSAAGLTSDGRRWALRLDVASIDGSGEAGEPARQASPLA